MALPPWAVDAIRRGIVDVARKAGDQETLTKLKQQATEIFRDLPETAARSVDAIVRTAKTGSESLQRWVDRHTEIAVPLINASGRLLDAPLGTGCPISDSVLQIGCDLLRDDCRDNGLRTHIDQKLEQLLPDCGIAVTGNLELAIASLTLLAPEWNLAIHRSQAIRLPGGTPLPDAIGSDAIREIGGVQNIEADDFNGLEQTLVILADPGDKDFELPARPDESVRFAVVLPVGTLRATYEGVPDAEAMLSRGADLVILPGNGLAGGPQCGVMIGHREWIKKLTGKPPWRRHASSDAVAAMMLSAFQSPASGDGDEAESAAVAQLMRSTEENLKSRAERMATRLSGSESIHSCQITDHPATLTEKGRWHFPSRQIRVRHASKSAEQWAKELADGQPAVAVAVHDAEIAIDLRWVRAADDAALAQQLEV